MRKSVSLIFFLLFTLFLSAEEFKVKAGGCFGLTMFDYFTPVDTSVSGRQTSVSSIKNIDKDLWCITLISESKNDNFPKYYEYYVHRGDVIEMCRFPDIQTIHKLKIISITWNEAILEVME